MDGKPEERQVQMLYIEPVDIHQIDETLYTGHTP